MKIILTLPDEAARVEATRLRATYGEDAVAVLSTEPDEPAPTLDKLFKAKDPLAVEAVTAWYIVKYGDEGVDELYITLASEDINTFTPFNGQYRIPNRTFTVRTTSAGLPSIDLSLGFPKVVCGHTNEFPAKDSEAFEQIVERINNGVKYHDTSIPQMTFEELRSWFISPLRRRVTALEMPSRVKNYLYCKHIRSLDHLIAYDRKTLLFFPGMGEKGVSSIEKALKEIGFSLR